VHQTDIIRNLAAGISRLIPGAVARRTLETRWFGEGDPPAALVEWFEVVCGNIAPDPWRCDVYLAMGRPDLNVKLRAGRLEVKRRQQAGRVMPFTEDAEGWVERWDKWVLPWPAVPRPGEEESPAPEQWIQVWKSRRLARLEVGETVTSAKPVAVPLRMCCIELTRLSVHEAAWWSVCFEASAPEDELDGTFLRAVNHVFALHESPPLDLAHSYGYPQWLMNVCG